MFDKDLLSKTKKARQETIKFHPELSGQHHHTANIERLQFPEKGNCGCLYEFLTNNAQTQITFKLSQCIYLRLNSRSKGITLSFGTQLISLV